MADLVIIQYFRGKYLVVINKTPTPQDNMADLVINDSIGKVCKELDEQLSEN